MSSIKKYMENVEKKCEGKYEGQCGQCQGGCHGMAFMGAHGCHGGKCHHLLKIILKLIIIMMIFCFGFKLGVITGSLRGNGEGRTFNRGGYGMMQGYRSSNLEFNNVGGGTQIPIQAPKQ